jgi:hypothetical protein
MSKNDEMDLLVNEVMALIRLGLEGVIPYDLTADPVAYVLLTPGWEERLQRLAPRRADAGPERPPVRQYMDRHRGRG